MTAHLGNCLFYAVAKVVRHGGKITIEKPQFGWWPHIMHVDKSGCVTEFVPVGPKRRRFLPPPIFWGRVETWGVLVSKTTDGLND
jgi:hypothetical protein